jgi:hypothetical protein
MDLAAHAFLTALPKGDPRIPRDAPARLRYFRKWRRLRLPFR